MAKFHAIQIKTRAIYELISAFYPTIEENEYPTIKGRWFLVKPDEWEGGIIIPNAAFKQYYRKLHTKSMLFSQVEYR